MTDQSFYYIKLKNGSDLISIVQSEDKNEVTLKYPLEAIFDLEYGYLMRDWTYMSKKNSCKVSKDFIVFMNPASDLFIDYHIEYFNQKNNKSTSSDMNQLLQEASISTKH